MTSTTIHLDALCVEMLLGVLPEEQRTPQRVTITVAVTLQRQTPPASLDQTFNYKTLYDYVQQRCQKPTLLAETLASDIVEYCLHSSLVQAAKVTVMKPDALARASVGVTVTGNTAP